MKNPALVLVLLLLPSLALAEGDSIQVGAGKLCLGMSEADVVTVVGPGLTLQRVADMVPRWVTYTESHGVHYRLVGASDPGDPMAWLTFEDGKLTRVTRLLGDFGSSDGETLVSALLAALDSLGASTSADTAVKTASWSDGRNEFRMIEFVAGEKQIHLSSSVGLVQLVENLGRGDVADVRMGK